MKRLGIVAELGHETRVAATPVTVKQLLGLGYEVVVEKGAGESASFRDEAYEEAGALIVGADEAWGADVVLRINPPTQEEIGRLADGATLIGTLSPGLRPDLVEALSERPITALGIGCRAAHFPCPINGRAQLDGEHRRVPGRDRGGARVHQQQPAWPVVGITGQDTPQNLASRTRPPAVICPQLRPRNP